MKNIVIFKYSTGEKLSGEKAIEALRDIINNDSKDYSYNFGMAQRTVEYFNISL
jgi:hypothetical protein